MIAGSNTSRRVNNEESFCGRTLIPNMNMFILTDVFNGAYRYLRTNVALFVGIRQNLFRRIKHSINLLWRQAQFVHIGQASASWQESVQKDILQDYRDDFAKHAPLSEVEKIRWIWDSVPVQLAKENNKFIFSHVHEGKRSAELEDALLWLRDAGLITPLYLVEKPQIPLSGEMDMTYFKVYLSDIGLLRCRAGLSPETILSGDPLFVRFKGAFSENYALNEMIAQGLTCCFWRSGNTAEIDLLLEAKGHIIPVEVKSADNTRAKSFKEFCRRYQPRLGIKTSLKNIGQFDCEGCKALTLPLYLLWNWQQYCE